MERCFYLRGFKSRRCDNQYRFPGGQFGGGYPEWRNSLYESFAICKQKIHLVRENSHAYATLNILKKILEEHRLDFLFIDGDHTYNGVKRDFEMYSKLLRKGG